MTNANRIFKNDSVTVKFNEVLDTQVEVYANGRFQGNLYFDDTQDCWVFLGDDDCVKYSKDIEKAELSMFKDFVDCAKEEVLR